MKHPAAGYRWRHNACDLPHLAGKGNAMIYKFKSKAAGDVIMLGPNGDRVLELIGKDRTPQGIIEISQMPEAIAALMAAVAADDAARAAPAQAEDSAGKPEGISLRQRAWPLVEMLKRAQAENEPILWG